MPSGVQDADDSSKIKTSINERAQACEEFLSELQKLDSEADKELEKCLMKDQKSGGKS